MDIVALRLYNVSGSLPVYATTFNKGDKVVMHSCGEANFPKYKGKIWTCKTDSYIDKSKEDVVFLDGFSGCFSSRFLQVVSM